jgi:hypothetical protein
VNLLKITTVSGKQVLINVQYIVSVSPYGNNYTDIITVKDHYSVNLSLHDVKVLLEEASYEEPYAE